LNDDSTGRPASLEDATQAAPPAGADHARRWVGLLRAMEPLKHLPRTGWVDRGVGDPESVAAHSWRLAMLAFVVASDLGLNAAHAMALALIHDLPEAITGDHTPFGSLATEQSDPRDWRRPAARAEKTMAERAALARIVAAGGAHVAAEIVGIWEDYVAEQSPEARLIHQLDKLEAYLQGWEYAADGRLARPDTLRSFQIDCDQLVTEPAARFLLEAIEEWAGAATLLGGGNRELKPE